ncbi:MULTISPECIES: sodium:solute symporter [Bacteroidota]|uniref:Sodium:solute symporter n=1 Tax=Flectobacillus rivi TaxID=2984209 RepID=A0ABT6Z4H7_9BACT|nr:MULTISPECIES: sodium:solute symporter [Bacteroidota]MDI9876035.1 sodium:solute symporter [Flectobacillus rivi]NBB27873.1 sodium:solute symporter [Cellulophaga sp. BC115SP]
MSTGLAFGILAVYFLLLIVVAHFTSKGADTNTFFTANKQSPWWLVAFGMIGTSISGVTFISVPGDVGKVSLSYYQIILGNLVGYFVIATVLLPLYYKLNLISIYTYLEKRFGFWSYKTGSAFFLLARTLGSAARLFLAVQVLQLAIFDNWHVPFAVSALVTIALIWVYTYKGGVKTIIVTDTLQTFFLLTALALTIILINNQLGLSFSEMVTTIQESKYSKMFFFDDFSYKHHFVKDFISGAFIAIVMTGLDQDLMQKNLTCKNIGEAQKNMFWFCCTFAVVTLMFIALGALLYIYADKIGFAIPAKTDQLYPMLALGGHFGTVAAITFLLGITAATYASSDSALTALTTAFCIDFMHIEKYEESQRTKIKHYVHIGFSALFFVVIMIFYAYSEQSIISAVFNIAGYTYGPLLGLFSFGLFTKTPIKDKLVPYLCIASPILTYIIDSNSQAWLNGYQFGFEKLLVNGAITFIGLWLLRKSE